jgi:NAD(P)-dependent dehydrogenase (short-subunit alcohol dehydrogenase family)
VPPDVKVANDADPQLGMSADRQGTAWDVAAAVIFLMSDTAGYITAQTLAVDGGLSNIH